MEIKHIDFAYGRQQVLFDVSAAIPAGKVTTIMGANGCGKSTLLHVMSKNLQPLKGSVLLKGEDIAQIPMKELAKKLAVVHQNNSAPQDLLVERLIGYGRVPYLRFGSGLSAKDKEIVEWAMTITNVEKYRHRTISELSGGQRQRVWIAMALAQKTEFLFLDEPTTYLDIRYQLEILNLVKKLNEEYGITIVMVLHDINQALSYSNEIICMKEGRILLQGSPRQVIEENCVEQMYGVKLDVMKYQGKEYVITV